MALLYMDSFDHYAFGDITEKWSSQHDPGQGDASTLGAFGRRGTNGLRIKASSSAGYGTTKAWYKNLNPADNTIIVGIAFNAITPTSGLTNTADPGSPGFPASQAPVLLMVQQAGTYQCWVRVDNAGTLSVFRGSTLLGTTSGSITMGAFVYVEVLLTIHNTTGVVKIRMNGIEQLSLTAQNTRGGAAVNAYDQLRIGWTGFCEWWVDDLFILDGSGPAPWNGFLGDCRVDALFPTAEGANSAWTPSSGADNSQLVDDPIPDDDVSYNAGLSAGLVDTFVVQNLPATGLVVYGVQQCISVKKTDAGACQVAPVVRHGTTDYVGTDGAPNTSYGYLLGVSGANPGTGAQWTEAEVNAAEFGYKRTL